MKAHRTRPPAIPRALARYRALRIFDLRYRLDCRVYAGASSLHGRQQIRFRLERAIDREALVLDWRPQRPPDDIARTVRSLTVNGVHPVRAQHRDGRLEIPARALGRGENCVELAWNAPIRVSASALTRYRDRADGATYVYSLFVPADASTVFPCFDQPDLKARFTLTLSMPPGWNAIANAPAAAIERAARRTRINFAETEPISTYAFAFAAGPFIALRARDDPVRLWVRRSRERNAQGHVDEILRLNSEAMCYCARYFGHPFPFRKYDLVLIPHFPYRGMEHAGATFLHEAATLLPKAPSEAARLQRAQLVFHETAHQWMGNLVTMRWFDDLWIKEGFANFIAYTLAERVCPREHARLAFHDLKASVQESDGAPGATALHHPLADLAHAKSAYNTRVYAKAPAVLRMLEHLLGTVVFRHAMRALVRSHAYGAIDWRDLVAAMEHACGRSLTRWAHTWLLRPGAGKARGPRAGIHAHEYVLPAPDREGVGDALRILARSHDALERMHLWAYLWAAVCNCTLDPIRFIEHALSHAAGERSDLSLARLVERLRIVIDRLLDVVEQSSIAPALESLAWRESRSRKPAEIRLAWTRALIRWSRSPFGYDKLHILLSSRRRDLGFGDRLALAGALVAGGRLSARSAGRALALEPGSVERRLAAHCLQAASPLADRKRVVLARWIEDAALPEYWIDAALPHFNHPAHAELTRPFLKPALDALPLLERTRKIFFVNRWLASFVGGQCGGTALGIIGTFLDASGLAPDLRLKVLEASSPLARDVAVYRHWHR